MRDYIRKVNEETIFPLAKVAVRGIVNKMEEITNDELGHLVLRKIVDLIVAKGEEIVYVQTFQGIGFMVGDIAILQYPRPKLNLGRPKVYIKDIYVELDEDFAEGILSLVEKEFLEKRERERNFEKHRQEYQRQEEENKRIVEEYLVVDYYSKYK